MLKGKFQNEDFGGHNGIIGPDDLQVTLTNYISKGLFRLFFIFKWMTAVF